MSKNAVAKNKRVSYSARLGIRLVIVGIAILTLSQSTGCNLGLHETAMMSYRDIVWAKRAFNLRYGNCDRPYAEHFENGFCAGYSATSNGGDGYVPALPPEDYRSFEYRSPDGARCVNSWFEGYPAGVAAARKDKAGTYHDVMISRMIDKAVTQSNTDVKLPGDVEVVSANGESRANASRDVPPAPSRYPAEDSMPSILLDGTFEAPPQAQYAPDGNSEIIQAEYSTSSNTPMASGWISN
ncbi:MAG: hypothetical protein ACI87E_003227 [Mariniblastus sp.]|jgi:hypothetical protein